MAKTIAAQGSVTDRLRAFLKFEDRFTKLNSARRWSTRAMKAEAFRNFPEQRLRQLREQIDTAPDPGVLPLLIKRIQGPQILGSSHYVQYIPPSRAAHILRLWPGGAEAAENDMRRFGTSTAELYAVAVVEAAEDPSLAHLFGSNDDPARTDVEMADLQSKMDGLRESLRTSFGPDDIAYGDIILVDGKRRAAATWRATNAEVEFGAPVESLIDWARQHRRELGV